MAVPSPSGIPLVELSVIPFCGVLLWARPKQLRAGDRHRVFTLRVRIGAARG